jgi:hypothetical protein
VKTISPTSLLPTITDTVSIDGYTQAGAEPNDAITNANSAVLKIQLSGTNAPSNAFGLAVSGSGAAGTTIKGLVINSFADDGLFINAQNIVIEGNFIDTNAAGTSDLGNGADGVHLERNVSKNEVAGNTISGNGSGVEIFGAEAKGNEVLGNFIGTNVSGAADLGNSGFGVFINAPGNFISATASGEGNTIAFNGQEAVVIAGVAATGNRILDNSIFSNGGQGIDLVGGTENAAGATQNDAKDPDTGPNTLQNKPVLDSATNSGGSTIIEGRLNSTPNRSYHHPVLLQPLWQRGQDVHP